MNGDGQDRATLLLLLSRDQARVLSVFVFSICLTVWVPFSIDFGGLNLRASQLLLPFVLIVLLASMPVWRVSIWSLTSLVCGVAWWLALTLWTVVGDADLGHPLGRVLLMALNLIQALAVYLLVVRAGDLRVALRPLLWSVAGFNILLVALSVAPALGLPVPERWLASEEAPLLVGGQLVVGTVRRFVFGGVLAGCVSAATAVLAIALFLDSHWRHRGLLWVSLVTAGLGMLLGFSRQSVVSLLCGLLVITPFMFGRGVMKLLKLAAWCAVGVVCAIGILLATPEGHAYLAAFAGRTAQFMDPEAYVSGTALGRTMMWEGMWRDIVRNPLVGQGQDAYLRYINPGEEGAHNFPLEVLHSTGLTGFVPYLLLHAIAPLLALAALVQRRVRDDMRGPVIGILGAYAAIAAASVTNLIYWNPLYWLVLALMIATVPLMEESIPPSSVQASGTAVQ